VIELIVYNYLKSALSVPVYFETPSENAPKEYVLVEKTGSSEENFIMSATFALQSHADSLYDAARLNQSVIEAMKGIISIDDVSSSRLNSDYNFTDTTTKKYRYQAVFDLVY